MQPTLRLKIKISKLTAIVFFLKNLCNVFCLAVAFVFFLNYGISKLIFDNCEKNCKKSNAHLYDFFKLQFLNNFKIEIEFNSRYNFMY